MIKRIYEASVEGNRVRGRPRRKWRDGIVSAHRHRGLELRSVGGGQGRDILKHFM